MLSKEQQEAVLHKQLKDNKESSVQIAHELGPL